MNKPAAAVPTDTPTDDPVDETKPGLSDEEKAALAAEDDQAGGGVPKGDEEKAADDPPQDAAAADSTDDAAAGPSAEVPRGNAANLELTTSRAVNLQDIGQRLNDLDAVQAEIDKKYDDEEMDAKEYLAQSRLITQETSDLNADVREAQFVANANKSFATTDWQKSVNEFVATNDEFQSTIMQGALNAALNALYTDDKNIGSSHNWYLQTAANAVRDQITPAQAAADNPTDKDPNVAAIEAAKAAAGKASDAKGKLPKTLSDVPVADDAGTSKDKFADIDSMTGVELEAALANMTPEQEQEYLRAE
jgi:uncharacterized protein YqgQ